MTLAAAVLVASLVPPAGPQSPPAAGFEAASQPGVPTELWELMLRDGSRLYGRVEREEEADLTFRTESGAVVTVRRANVFSLRRVRGSIVEGEFRRTDRNATRLIFGPTGRSLKKGQAYLGVFEFMMPFVQVGVTDRLSVGGGTPLLLLSEADWDRPFWFTPKFQIYASDRRQFSVGAFHMMGGGDSAGIAYGVGSFGHDDAALTVGAGVAYNGSDGRTGVVMVGGERRTGRNFKLVTESYIWGSGSGVASAGIRFIGENLSADLALAVPIGATSFFAFPVLNVVYVF